MRLDRVIRSAGRTRSIMAVAAVVLVSLPSAGLGSSPIAVQVGTVRLSGSKTVTLWKTPQALEQGRQSSELVSCVAPSGTRVEIDRVPDSWMWVARVVEGPHVGCRGIIRPQEFRTDDEARREAPPKSPAPETRGAPVTGQTPAAPSAVAPPGVGGPAWPGGEEARAAHRRGDYATTLRLVRPTAERGDAHAQVALGNLYERGQGVRQDFAEAAKWYRRAAEQGFTEAQFDLGVLYANGWGVRQDYTEAVKWYRRAAEQGDAHAQVNLGSLYANGQGVPQDYAEAVKWYRRAAEQGTAQAQYNLGVLCEGGKGVPQDYAEAWRWYRRAAEQGEASAQHNLGILYGTGRGVPRDDVLAHMWFSLATSRLVGERRAQAAKDRDLAAGVMTPAQLDEALRRARAWKPRPESGSVQVSPAPSESGAPSSATSTTTRASQPRLTDDPKTLVLIKEVREPRSKRQPEISLGSNDSGQTRHIMLAGEGVSAPGTVVVVCGDFTRSLPLTDVSQPSERRVAIYRVPDDVADTMLHARSCYLSVVQGHLLKIPLESLSAVWQRAGQAKGETAEVSRAGAVPRAQTSEKFDPSKPTIFLSPYTHEALVIPLEPGWTLAKKTQDAKTYVLQFLPANSPTQNIPRMVTVTTYTGLQEGVNARDFMMRNWALQRQSALEQGATLDWEAIEQDNPKDVLFEYTLKNHPRYKDQYEMQRMIAGDDGIHVILFHVKNTSVSPAERAEILRFLKRVSLKK